MNNGFAATQHGHAQSLEAGAISGAKGNARSNRPIYEASPGKERVAVLPECGHFPMSTIRLYS